MLDPLADRLARLLVRRADRPYGPLPVALAVLARASLELVVVPVILVGAGRRIDAALGLPALLAPSLATVAAAACFGLGVPWLAAAIFWQHRFRRGTPLPLVPPKVLLGTGPYRYTRNPMTLGAIFWLAGWALLANSPTALFGGVGFFTAVVLSYVKLVEERELETRFGDPYRRYRRQTAFLIPWSRRRA